MSLVRTEQNRRDSGVREMKVQERDVRYVDQCFRGQSLRRDLIGRLTGNRVATLSTLVLGCHLGVVSAPGGCHALI